MRRRPAMPPAHRHGATRDPAAWAGAPARLAPLAEPGLAGHAAAAWPSWWAPASSPPSWSRPDLTRRRCRAPSNADVVIAAAAPLSWDPAAISDSESAQLLSQVFEGLTVLDAERHLAPRPGRVVGCRGGGSAGRLHAQGGPDLQRRLAARRGRRAPFLAARAGPGTGRAPWRACSMTSRVPPPTRGVRDRRRPWASRPTAARSASTWRGRPPTSRPWPRCPPWRWYPSRWTTWPAVHVATCPSRRRAPTCPRGASPGSFGCAPTPPTGRARRRWSASAW